jgi:NAD(P)-dependent dehydrogenase (short-subunit alcohol dehydrogenase family)
MQLKEKVALVTGAGSGIGKASAIRFARAGAKVAVLSHTTDEIVKTAGEITSAGGQAIPVTADVSDARQMEQAFRQTVEKFGRLDVVFANAGINGVQAPIDEMAPEEFDRTISTNLRGTFLTIKYAVPYLKKQGSGSIIVTSSINGTRVFSNSGATLTRRAKPANSRWPRCWRWSWLGGKSASTSSAPGRSTRRFPTTWRSATWTR